ncbi:MAG: hypothetical protein Q9227_004714 [Pyrenula ochraceoflavens]
MASSDKKSSLHQIDASKASNYASAHPPQSSSSAASMHSLQEYPDTYSDAVDSEGLPPYTDAIPGSIADAPSDQPPPPLNSSQDSSDRTPQNIEDYRFAFGNAVPSSRQISYRTKRFQNPFSRNRGTAQKTLSVTQDAGLSSSSPALYHLVVRQAILPPEPYVYIKGTHERRTRDSQGKESRDTVIDFEFQVQAENTIIRGHDERLFDDVPGQMLRGARETMPYWRRLVLPTAEQKVFRGTRSKATAPIFKRAEGDLEGGAVAALQGLLSESPDQKQALQYWVERYVTDPASVKSFSFERELVGFDAVRVQNAVSAHIRSLNYRGTISVETRICNAGFLVYSPHWINRLRTNNFVWYLIVILQLWIITWPIIWLLEKRYEVVKTKWFFSHGREVRELGKGYDEEGWVRLWGRAIQMAAESRRKNGEWLTEEDLRLANDKDTVLDTEEAARQQRRQSGQGTWVDSAVGLASGLGEVHRDYNRAVGWGMDE